MSRTSPLAFVLVFALAAPGFAAEADGIARTADGKPDLTGNYDLASLTPFERDPRYGDRLEMTREEAEQIEKREAAAMAAANSASDPNREAPPPGGDGSAGASGKVGGYNAFWIDRGSATLAIDGKFRTSILVDPPNGRMPALTDQGKARRADQFAYAFENTGSAWWLGQERGPYDGPESLPTIVRCIYLGAATVPTRPILYNNVKTVVQTDTHVMILAEWMHWARIIRLDSEHVPPEIVSRGGDSIGWWEGDTLVVETTNFLVEGTVPPGLEITERFTPSPSGDLRYEFTVNDPDYIAPYSGELPWPKTDDQLYEYACHEGNYAMGNILRGARLLESEAVGGE